MKSSSVFRIIYILSIIFALIFLAKKGFISFGRLNINTDFFVSIILLVLGFFIYPVALKTVLKSQQIEITAKNCFLALGTTIFSKYIPGKVAMIYAISYKMKSASSASSIKMLSYNVILFQIFVIISGLITGVYLVLGMNDIPIGYKYLSVFFILVSLVIISSKNFFRIFSKILGRILKKELLFKPVQKLYVIKILLISQLFWLLWGFGVFFFVKSLGVELSSQSAVIFLYPFSICIGILSIISPGGVGVREGVFALFIIAMGNNPAIAAEISVLSRLWFFLGEILIFSISFIISYIAKEVKTESK